jgi:hypothetical protein
MRKSTLVVLVAALAALTAGTAHAGTTFTVTDTSDSGPGTLRQAILDANASPGKDTIAFDVPGGATIFLSHLLPAVTDPVVIDGTTEPGYTFGRPQVVLFTANTVGPSLAYGLDIQAGKSEVSGLSIGGFQTGIVLEGAPGDTVTASAIGPNPNETSAQPNGTGISITNSDDEIGGTGKGDGNVISGNTGDGVLIRSVPRIRGGARGNAIQGDLIGTNGNGTAALGNGGAGVEIVGASTNLVGGSLLVGAGNVISGNALYGVLINGGDGNQISSNLIGTSADGMSAIANAQGIRIEGASSTLIGRSTGPHTIRGGGNVISGNAFEGIVADDGGDNEITGNVVGLAGDGKTPLPNIAGVYVFDETALTVGSERDPNVIAANLEWGVHVDGDTSNVRISANSIFGNDAGSYTGLAGGIDLNSDDVTPNDPNDADTGPNGLQNFPVLTSVTRQGGQLVIGGVLNSRPFGTYRLEFFANTSCDPSGYGEGETYLGSETAVAPSGNVTFSVKFPLNPSAATPIVTATATDQYGNTSEFSACSPGG